MIKTPLSILTDTIFFEFELEELAPLGLIRKLRFIFELALPKFCTTSPSVFKFIFALKTLLID